VSDALGKISRSLLYEQVAKRTRDLIRSRGLWGSYLPAERELAAKFGVSQVTVRRGLELLVREGLIVRRRGQGTRVLSRPVKRGRRAGLVVVAAEWTDVSTGYLGHIMAGLSAGASRSEWTVAFRNLSGASKSAALIEFLREEGAGGLVLLSVTDRKLCENVLSTWGGPTVLVDHCFEDLALTSVNDDSLDGALEVTRHLLSQGHSRVAYLECSDRRQNPWRYQGWAEAQREAGIGSDDRLVIQCRGNPAEAKAATERLLELEDPPTAIMGFERSRAWGAWQAVEERGLEVGRDVALACFGYAGEPGMPEGLSCYEIDWHDLGRTAAAELDALMSGSGRPGETISVPGHLVIRGSSGPLRRKGRGGS
jgi:LacI family transcriptional regulator